jgi:SAM-dependent methyltransferase
MSAPADDAKCLCCRALLPADAITVTQTDRRKGLHGSWNMVACDRCGVYSLVPLPSEEELGRFYAAYTDAAAMRLQKGTGSRHPFLRRVFHKFTGDVDPRDFVIVPAAGRVLDYGSGQATYLRDFHDRGIDIWGAEVTDTLVDACRAEGLRIRKVEDFASIPFEDAAFDVVYLMQVFEHLRDPRHFMVELARIVKPGGQLYLAVPNISSSWRRVFRDDWVSGWFAPFHLAHYNAAALGELAAKHGFDVKRSWSSTPDSWFRLNLRARFRPGDRFLDSGRSMLDSLPLRLLCAALLRVCELFMRERDCLVVHLERR